MTQDEVADAVAAAIDPDDPDAAGKAALLAALLLGPGAAAHAEGGACKPGERADLTGCRPAGSAGASARGGKGTATDLPAAAQKTDNGAGSQATPEEHAYALATAKAKFAVVPAPTEAEVAAVAAGMAKKGANLYRKDLLGNSSDRKKRRALLLKEFGDGTVCPCVYCGVRIGEGTMEQDKMLTTRQGGRYRVPNLVPACSGCNKHRGDKPFAEAIAGVKVNATA